MKTTIDFPEDLLCRAKIAAAERKTTLRELVIHSLESMISGSQAENSSKEGERKETLKHLLKSMQASNTKPIAPLPRAEIYDR